MNVSALSESVKQTKLEMVQTISQSCESLDSFVHWIKHCRSLKKKCCFKAKKHKIILWKKKIPSSETKVILQLSPQTGLLAFINPCSSNTLMEVQRKGSFKKIFVVDKSHIFDSNVVGYSWFWPEGSIDAPNWPWRHESRTFKYPNESTTKRILYNFLDKSHMTWDWRHESRTPAPQVEVPCAVNQGPMFEILSLGLFHSTTPHYYWKYQFCPKMLCRIPLNTNNGIQRDTKPWSREIDWLGAECLVGK